MADRERRLPHPPHPYDDGVEVPRRDARPRPPGPSPAEVAHAERVRVSDRGPADRPRPRSHGGTRAAASGPRLLSGLRIARPREGAAPRVAPHRGETRGPA